MYHKNARYFIRHHNNFRKSVCESFSEIEEFLTVTCTCISPKRDDKRLKIEHRPIIKFYVQAGTSPMLFYITDSYIMLQGLIEIRLQSIINLHSLILKLC